MSLNLILPPDGVQALTATWPDEPRVYQRKPGDLGQAITAAMLHDHIEAGCIPADEIAVIKAPHPSLNHKSFTVNGRTDTARLRKLYGQGYTIRIGNLQRIIPAMARASRAIQQETGYSNYVHAFLTPPGNQGLRHHWDQQMAVLHLTFAIRERTPLWLAEQLAAGAIDDPRFRRILRPAEVTGPGLAAQVRETRDALVKYLTSLDPETVARSVREAALTELEYRT